MELKRFVTDLVDLGALGSGAFRLRLGPVKLRPLLESCVEDLRPEADQKKLSLCLEIAVGTPSIIQADEARLRQVLLILLGNGVKFTREGGVTLTAGRGMPSGTPERNLSQGSVCAGACLELRVRDTGPGLSPDDQRKILQLFSRLDHVPKGFSPGLSLALAARLCVAMGGALSVSSDGMKGSVFIVRLPLGISNAIPVGADEEFAPAMSGLNTSRCRTD